MSGNPYDAPQQSAAAGTSFGTRHVAIRRIDVISAGTMLGAFYAIIGLIVGGLFSLFALMGAMAAQGGAGAAGLMTGVGAIIFFPLLYGIMGFIGGLIASAIYNAVAAMVGGIRIDLEG